MPLSEGPVQFPREHKTHRGTQKCQSQGAKKGALACLCERGREKIHHPTPSVSSEMSFYIVIRLIRGLRRANFNDIFSRPFSFFCCKVVMRKMFVQEIVNH